MARDLDVVRVLTRTETIKLVGLGDRTWDRLEARGETPAKTKLSPNRVGYRVCDVKDWLDRRRIGHAVAVLTIIFIAAITFTT
jgi:predicted DNA-binding transcriptional regulator AlpA